MSVPTKNIFTDSSNDIRVLRNNLCNDFLVVFSILAIPALSASLYRYVDIGWQSVMALHIAIVMILWAITIFKNRIPYWIRAGYISVGFLSLGMSGLWNFGFVSTGVAFVVASSPIATAFFGIRTGFVFLILSISGMAIIGVLTVTGYSIKPIVDMNVYAYSFSTWMSVFLVSTVLAIGLYMTLYIFTQKLILTLNKAGKYLDELESHKKDLERIVSERTKALKHSNTDLIQFAQVAAHDMRSPLTNIGVYSDLLRERSRDNLDEESDSYLKSITDSAQHLNTMIQDLLNNSHVDSELKELEPVNINEIIETLKKQFMNEIKGNEVTLSYDSLPIVYADRVQIFRVLQNLMANAIRYRDKNRPLTINLSAERNNDKWKFCFCDNGIGIDSKNFETIFEIFKKAEGNTNSESTGIGLATCKKIIERHNGKIWVESKVGEGSSFYFLLKSID